MRIVRFGYSAAVLAGLAITGCAGKTARLSPDDSLRMEVGLTSQDFRSVAQYMTRSLILCPQIARAASPPTIALHAVRNNTADLINTGMFLDRMRSEMIRFGEGRVQFLDRELLKAVRRENEAKRRGKMTRSDEKDVLGADFFLTGQIDSIDKTAGVEKVTYWRLSFRLTDSGTTAVVWQDDYEIKKYERRGLGE